MELKVWCDGIQRIVCGATPATTCQDVVFALAHATGQTGRFILLEKWKNNERVLAPSDRPILALAKWGEYANDVSFIMKKSGDVNVRLSSNNNNNNKKSSDSDLALKRQKVNNQGKANYLENNHHHRQASSEKFPTSKSMSAIEQMMMVNNQKTGSSAAVVAANTNQIRFASHQQKLTTTGQHLNHHPSPLSIMEPVYGTIQKHPTNRPRQPPPYQEAIAKSSLVNIINTQPSSHHNHQNQYQKQQQQQAMGLISIQQETLKKQEKNIADIEKEIDIVQRKMSSNELIANRYRDEMEYLHQLWMEQDSLIEQLESENMEQELTELIDDGQRYELEMKQLKMKLTHCETEISKRNEEMSRLMDKIREQMANQRNGEDDDHQHRRRRPRVSSPDPTDSGGINPDPMALDRLKASIQDKNLRIENQKMDLQVLDESLEHFDKNIQTKNSIIDQLVGEIKQANVEGLTLQRSTMAVTAFTNTPATTTTIPDDDLDGSAVSVPPPPPPPPPPAPPSAVVTNRKIPVSLHELGNTVPTKKNPDGIWV